MKELWESGKIRIFLSVLLVLVMLSLFTRNVENNIVSTSVNTLTYGLSKVSAAAKERNTDGMSYDELKDEYDALSEANRELRARLVDYYDVKEENARLWKFYELKKEHKDYQFVPATVLRRDSNDEFYSFTIDKGTASDISTGDPVMGENGIIGYISEADANTAKVVTILSPQASIGATDKASKDTGIITGSSKYADDNLTMFAKLKSEHKVKTGDIITTTGISGIYPKNLIIGEVTDIGYDTYDTSYYAVVKPYEDIRKITDIAVITSFDGEGEILKRNSD
ncbi:MAG: rod shape-determining protein MreC [Ruminococcus sp.]|nr:rod shape-determining protein MreC [Ruminococcus sp.]